MIVNVIDIAQKDGSLAEKNAKDFIKTRKIMLMI